MELIYLMLVFTVTHCIAGADLEFQSLYRRIPQTYLRAIPQRVLSNTSVEACARACATETDFECKSFDVDNTQRECHLHNHTHNDPLIGLQSTLGVDHYRTAYEKLFNRIPNHVITMRHNRNIRGLTVEECARRCILEMSFKCRGFDFERMRRNCWLTEKVLQEVEGLKKRTNTDYYERKTNGLLSRFINYGYGSLQTIEGVQTHTKIVIGVSMDACAQLCLAETAFTCVSFDYVFGEASCQLSQYIAANVHGLRTEFEAGYHVMHFELIDEYLEYFYPTPYSSVLGNNARTWRHVTPDTCARKCLEERDFICRSFDYQIQKGTCLLSHVTGSDAGGLFTPEGVHVHHFEMKPSLDCGGHLTGERGTLASPNWPRHYSHHLNCSWTITVPQFKIIHLRIYHLDLGYQEDDPCDPHNDILAFSETTEDQGRLSTCVKNFQTEFTTLTNRVNVSFTTNAENDAQGFRIFYQADWPCRITLTEDNGEFASPNWPGTYPPMTSCHWLIRAPAGARSRVTLRVNSVELEDHLGSSCRTAYDKIQIHDGDSKHARRVKTLCGHERASSFTSTGDALFVAFISDSRVQAKGFHASYTFIPYTTTTSTTTTQPTTTTAITSAVPPLSDDESDNTTASSGSQHQTVIHPGINATTMTSPTRGDNSSSSVQLAMTGEQEEQASGPLEATFIEQVDGDYVDKATGNNVTVIIKGKTGDDIGMGGKRPEISSTDVKRPDDTDYSSLILGVIMAFLCMFLVMSLALGLVCRHYRYRRRAPKLRQGTNMQNSEEHLSLCHKTGATPDGDFQDEADIEDAARLPLPGNHEPVPDIEFHNPLYKDRQRGDSDSPQQDDATDIDTTVQLARQSPRSSLRFDSLERSPRRIFRSRDFCDGSRSSIAGSDSDTETCNTVETHVTLTPSEFVYVDCLTTV